MLNMTVGGGGGGGSSLVNFKDPLADSDPFVDPGRPEGGSRTSGSFVRESFTRCRRPL